MVPVALVYRSSKHQPWSLFSAKGCVCALVVLGFGLRPVSYHGRWMTQFARRNPGYPLEEVDTLESDLSTPILDILGVGAFPSGQNRYGPAGRGYLTAHGLVLPVKLRNVWLPNLEIKGFDADCIKVMLDISADVPVHASDEVIRLSPRGSVHKTRRNDVGI